MKLSEIRKACEREEQSFCKALGESDDEFRRRIVSWYALPALLEAVDRYFHGDEDFDEALLHAGIEVDE